MKLLKKLLGVFCLIECLLGIIFSIQESLDEILPLIGLSLCFGIYAFFLLKKTPTNISPIRIFLGGLFAATCIIFIDMTFFTSSKEYMLGNTAVTVFFVIITFFLLKPKLNQKNNINNSRITQISDELKNVNFNNNLQTLTTTNLQTISKGQQVIATNTEPQTIQEEQPYVSQEVIYQQLQDRQMAHLQQAQNMLAETMNQVVDNLASGNTVNVTASIEPSTVPENIISDMRATYSPMQANNDLRILKESINIMQTTTKLDTFFTRYELAMQKVLTLQQAGINLGNSMTSQAIIQLKYINLERLLQTMYNKELKEIVNLKTSRGKLNRINKLVNTLLEYNDELEFINGYNEIINNLNSLKEQQEMQEKSTIETTTYDSPFHIRPNTYPAKDGYNNLDENEYKFFSEFAKALAAENIPAHIISLTRLSSGMLNIDCPNAYLGKIDIKLDKSNSLYIQYFGPRGGLKELHTESLQECIDTIPTIIKYIKVCQK